MKQLLKKNKILCAILLIIVIAVIVILVKGFNVELPYKEHYRILVNIGQQVESSKVKEITEEVFKDEEVIIKPATKFKDCASILVSSVTEENKTNLVNKLNEKYNLDLKVEDLYVEYIPHTKLIDVINPYITPFIITTIILAIYVAIRFRKLNTIKSVFRFLIYIIFAELLAFSLVAIFRIPLGKFIASIIIIAYIIGATLIFKKLEDEKIASK